MKAWISISAYVNIMLQAADNNGLATIEAKGFAPFEIKVDEDYAKKEIERLNESLKEK